MIAIIPLRAQPLHLGHVNLLVNASRLFEGVRVIPSQQPLSDRNPYSLEMRTRWLMETVRAYGMTNVAVRQVGSHGYSPEARIERYLDGLGLNDCGVVSNNPGVQYFWQQNGFDVYNIEYLHLDDLCGAPDIFMERREGNGSIIRSYLDDAQMVRRMVPEYVWGDMHR